MPKACDKTYGRLALQCRRLLGHQGDCGCGNEVERALLRAFETTKHLRALEREGERIPPEIWSMTLRQASESE